jgi:hypothetical protein
MREKRNAYRTLVGKPEGSSQLERPRYRWEVNIRRDIRERGWCGMGQSLLAYERNHWRAIVNIATDLWVS